MSWGVVLFVVELVFSKNPSFEVRRKMKDKKRWEDKGGEMVRNIIYKPEIYWYTTLS